ncbi:MAG: SRPBCC family protein [Jhaorihella sp.]
MKFSSNEDIEAPIGQVFIMLSDFEAFERSAIRRGIEVRRNGETAQPVAGLSWDVTFMLRGKARRMHLVLSRYDSPNAMRYDATSPGLDSVMEIELLALSPRRTRMSVKLTLTPNTLSARLFVQSLKLAKAKLTRRFTLKVADYAKDMEDRHGRIA